jgi:hypothetical protein
MKAAETDPASALKNVASNDTHRIASLLSDLFSERANGGPEIKQRFQQYSRMNGQLIAR